MAKQPMQLVHIYAHQDDRKGVVERLQLLGAVDITEDTLPEDAQEEFFHYPAMEEQAASFDRLAFTAQQALQIVNQAAPEKKGLLASLSGRREVSAAAFFSCAATSRAVLQECQRAVTLQKTRAECAAEQQRIQAALAQLEPWQTLDVPFRFSGTRNTAAFIGMLPRAYTQEELIAALAAPLPAEEEPLFDVEILSEEREQTCFFLVCLREQAETMQQVLRGLGFARPPVIGNLTPALTTGTETGSQAELPSGERQRLLERQEALRQEEAAAQTALEELAAKRSSMEMLADYYTVRAEKYRAIGHLRHTEHTFLVTGYVPAADVPQLREQLEEDFPVAIDVCEADPEKAPVKLHNNAFARPAESITEMYAMPLASDIDPTPIMSFFYYLFFGMMLSDAGYGLLLALGAGWLIKKCRPEPSMRRNLRLFQYCGVSTVLWGLVFGSFFGDAPEVIARTFFNVNFTMPRLIDPINDAITLLLLSIALGMAQILAGLGARFYMQWHAGDRFAACADTGLWMTTLVGFSLLAVGMTMLPALTIAGGAMAAVSMLGLVLTQGRKKKGPMKVLSGLASLYDVTGYVSDLMSYSRLMALGLTTGVMGSVFNMLGSMFGRSVLGAALMVVIFLVGHAINFGINALGTYVHTLRLQYVELFSKFYEGGGRPFSPFALHSRYVRIQETPKA